MRQLFLIALFFVVGYALFQLSALLGLFYAIGMLLLAVLLLAGSLE